MRFCAPVLAALICAGGFAAEDAVPVLPGVNPAGDAGEALVNDASYAIGRDIGNKVGGVVSEYDLNRERFMAGLESALSGATAEMSDEQMEAVLRAFQEVQMEKAQKQAEAEAAEAPQRLEKNAEWLAENAKKEGVTQLPSGLQYKVITSGDAAGVSPAPGDRVECHYVGTKLDGTVFDSSVARGTPAVFSVGQLIAGWNEALTLMKPGDKWKLFIPSELAYGKQGPPSIGSDQILVFELELINVLK